MLHRRGKDLWDVAGRKKWSEVLAPFVWTWALRRWGWRHSWRSDARAPPCFPPADSELPGKGWQMVSFRGPILIGCGELPWLSRKHV